MTLESSFSLSQSSASSLGKASDAPAGGFSKYPVQKTSNELFYGPENSILKLFSDDLPSHSSFDFSQNDLFPISIFGPSGSGKSELANYLAERLVRLNSNSLTETIRFSVSDLFRDFIDAIEIDELDKFRQSLVSPNRLLLLDNFEELLTKPSLFDEIIYLLDHGRQLIITSSVHPADFVHLPYRITSRLLNGLSLPLENPSAETLLVVLQSEIQKYGSTISPEASRWLIDRTCSTIPEIKQCVSKLRIHLDFSNPIELSAVFKVLGKSSNHDFSLNEIAKIVAKKQRLKISDLKSQSRKQSIVLARGIAVYLARQIFQYKFDDIGKFFGNRDHTTILHAHRKFKKQIETDAELKKCFDDIYSTIRKKLKT